jgi:hypothetical protein
MLRAIVPDCFSQLEEQLADFLKASPKLARDLARWQADD